MDLAQQNPGFTVRVVPVVIGDRNGGATAPESSGEPAIRRCRKRQSHQSHAEGGSVWEREDPPTTIYTVKYLQPLNRTERDSLGTWTTINVNHIQCYILISLLSTFEVTSDPSTSPNTTPLALATGCHLSQPVCA